MKKFITFLSVACTLALTSVSAETIKMLHLYADSAIEYPGIQRAVANTTDLVIGVFNGVFYTDPTTQKPTFKNYYPGTVNATDIMANVIDDPNVVFSIDSDGAFAVADIYKNFAITNVTGNTATGISKVQLDFSVSGLTTSGTVLQAIDVSQDVDNDTAGSANVDVLVRINNHFYSQGTGI